MAPVSVPPSKPVLHLAYVWLSACLPGPHAVAAVLFAMVRLSRKVASSVLCSLCAVIAPLPTAALCLVYDFPTYFREDCIGVAIFAILVTNLVFGGTSASLIKMLRVPNARQDYPQNQVRDDPDRSGGARPFWPAQPHHAEHVLLVSVQRECCRQLPVAPS